MVYLASFVVLVAGTVGCGYVEEGFVCKQTFYSRLTKKEQPSEKKEKIKEDLIYSIKVRTNSDLMVFNDRGIQNAVEDIVYSGASDFREKEIKSPLAIEKLCNALNLTPNNPIKPADPEIGTFYCAKRQKKHDTAVPYSHGVEWDLEDSLISGSSSVFCVTCFRHLAYSNLPLEVDASPNIAKRFWSSKNQTGFPCICWFRHQKSNLMSNGKELKSPSDIEGLCNEEEKSKNTIPSQSNTYTIKELNTLLGTSTFYATLHNQKPKKRFSKAVEELVDKTKDCRKKPFNQLNEDEQYRIKRLNRLLLEESYPREMLNILISSEKIMDFVDAVEKLFGEGKELAESECMISNDLYILQESTDESKADVIIAGVITKLLKQRYEVAFEKGLNLIAKKKEDYLEKVTQSKSNGQIEADKELLKNIFGSLNTVREDLLKEIDPSANLPQDLEFSKMTKEETEIFINKMTLIDWIYWYKKLSNISDFYDILKEVKIHDNYASKAEIVSLVNETNKYRSTPFSELDVVQQGKIENLNRLLLKENLKGAKFIILCK